MKREIQLIRNTILAEAWETHKAEWEMDKIASAMGMNLKTAYRVIKNYKEKEFYKHLRERR